MAKFNVCSTKIKMRCKGILKDGTRCKKEAELGDLCLTCFKKNIPEDKVWQKIKYKRKWEIAKELI